MQADRSGSRAVGVRERNVIIENAAACVGEQKEKERAARGVPGELMRVLLPVAGTVYGDALLAD